MHDQFDVTLEDADLLGEVELTTSLIIAASESEEHRSRSTRSTASSASNAPPEPQLRLTPRGSSAGREEHRPAA